MKEAIRCGHLPVCEKVTWEINKSETVKEAKSNIDKTCKECDFFTPTINKDGKRLLTFEKGNAKFTICYIRTPSRSRNYP